MLPTHSRLGSAHVSSLPYRVCARPSTPNPSVCLLPAVLASPVRSPAEPTCRARAASSCRAPSSPSAAARVLSTSLSACASLRVERCCSDERAVVNSCRLVACRVCGRRGDGGGSRDSGSESAGRFQLHRSLHSARRRRRLVPALVAARSAVAPVVAHRLHCTALVASSCEQRQWQWQRQRLCERAAEASQYGSDRARLAPGQRRQQRRRRAQQRTRRWWRRAGQRVAGEVVVRLLPLVVR